MKTMTKKQLQKAWEKVTREARKRSKLGKRLKNKKIPMLGELLLFAQVLLSKIEAGENRDFNSIIYKKTMNFYCKQMKSYA